MKVNLINYTGNCIDTMATAVSKCYDNEPSNIVVQKCIGNKHTSVTEHSLYTFEISGVSRTFLAQVTRHRHLSFTVESQRYTLQDNYIVPQTIKDNPIASVLFNKNVMETFSLYNKLIEIGIPKEDARFILPEATETKLVISGNYRAFMEFCEKRMAPNAQWEIREFAFAIDRLIHKVTPLKSFKETFGY